MKLDNHTLALIAVGASVSANCQPCLERNLCTALKCGAGAQEIAEAIEIGKRVRHGAAAKMDQFAISLDSSTSIPRARRNISVSVVRQFHSQEAIMDNTRSLNHILETIAWGLLLILWGVTVLFDFIPVGIGIVGTGLILLGLNGVRSLNGIPTKGSTSTLGILALLWGGLELAGPILHLPFELSDWAIFAILLIVLGAIMLTRSLLQIRKTGVENLHLNG